MIQRLLPLTKLVLAISALVQFIFALVALVIPGLMHSFLWPTPFEPVPFFWMRYDAALYLAMSFAALYALQQNEWTAARTYLAVAATYITLGLVLNIVAALTPPGPPPVTWLYLLLSIVYLPLVYWVWRQQSTRATST